MSIKTNTILSAIFPSTPPRDSKASPSEVRSALLLLKIILADRGRKTLEMFSSQLPPPIFHRLCELAIAASEEGFCSLSSVAKDEKGACCLLVFDQVLTERGEAIVRSLPESGTPVSRDVVLGYLTDGAFFSEPGSSSG